MGIHTEYPAPAPLWNLNHERAFSLFLLLLLVPPVTAQFQNTPPPPPDPFARLRFDKTMAVVLVILVVVFFALGIVSIYTRQCAERRIVGRIEIPVVLTGGGERRQPRGLDSAIIETFPIFVYSEVKGLKIGRATLECAVCLNEFRDDETLRLIPKCSHVFHPDCIDAWLLNHSTCPVCRANLVPKPDETTSSVEIQTPDPSGSEPSRNEPNCNTNCIDPVDEDGRNRIMTEPPTANLDEPNRPVRSRSIGFGIGRLFPRSYSTGHSLVRQGEDCERFTLRLPEEVRDRLVSSVTLSRTMTWQRESSERSGYRTRSVGRRYLHYERFGGESRLDRWGFIWTPPFLGRAGLRRSNDDANKGMAVMDEGDVGERSSDCLFSKV